MKPLSEPSNDHGVVFKKHSFYYEVHTEGGTIACQLSARLYLEEAGPKETRNGRGRRKAPDRKGTVGRRDRVTRRDPVAVGDAVRFLDGGDGTGLIVEVLPRENTIARRSAVPMPSATPHEQVIASNLDQVVVVFAAANPKPKWRMLDRYLVAAEAKDLPTLICITKLDLAPPEGPAREGAFWEMVAVYRQIGYPVHLTSAVTGVGLTDLQSALDGRRSVLMGKSGAGKTSLLNAIQPELGLRVRAVSQATGKGRHTTSHLEMFPLPGGGEIIDTPGAREFGLWDVAAEDLDWCFPEMRPHLGACRFGLGCRHDEEPGCAVRAAVVAGEISPYRWQSFLRLQEEL